MTELAASVYHDNLVEAWKQGCRCLANPPGPSYVLVSSFGSGWIGGPAHLRTLDAAARKHGFEAPSSVASVLCPSIVRRAAGTVAEALDAGQRMYGRGRTRGLRFSGWRHTYFERLTGAWYDRFREKRSIKNNRLLEAIGKLNSWPNNSEAALYLHTDIPADSFRTRGSPCLQYLQIRSYGDKQVSLAALYRSHDYSNKALGNFIGLDGLGRFIAERTGRTFTGADVVSLNPFIGSKSKTNGFVADT